MRGVGVMPPYTPKSPQPTLSTRMKTMLGLVSAAAAWRIGTSAPPIVTNAMSATLIVCFTRVALLRNDGQELFAIVAALTERHCNGKEPVVALPSSAANP